MGLQAALRPRTVRHASLRRVKEYAFDNTETQAVAVDYDRRPLLEVAVPVLSRVALRFTPRVQREELAGRLTAAGLAARLTPQQFLALKTVLACLGIVLALASGGVGARGFMFAIVLAGGSLIIPDFLLRRHALARAERMTVDLPEAIDQIVVSLEAGVSFDAAVSFYVRRSKAGLARELQLMLSEMRMGETRSNALRRLADRVPSADLRNFVQTLLQSESMGTLEVRDPRRTGGGPAPSPSGDGRGARAEGTGEDALPAAHLHPARDARDHPRACHAADVAPVRPVK